MNWDDFLAGVADDHGLSGAQKDWFLRRFCEENRNKTEQEFQIYLSELDMQDPVKTFRKQMTGVYRALSKSLPELAGNTRNKADKIRPWLKRRYEASFADALPESGETISQQTLRQACVDLLERQKRLTTNALMAKDGITFEPDDLFVPLGLVERKKRPKRRDIESSEQGSQLYEPTEEEITQKFNHQEFFDQVIRDGDTKSKGKRLAVIGEPGAGKTTLLQKIGDWLRDNNQVPIWIPLASVGTKPLQEYLLKDWLQDAAATIEPPSQEWKSALQHLLKSNQACLLLDGVDEMAVSNALRWIGDQLRAGWANSVRVVLTCRLNVWESSALEGFDVYRNLDFDYPEQVRQFIDQFFQREGADLSLGERLKEELKKPGKERIRDTIKNPLRLSLLCYSWELGDGELPETKAELYRQFVNAFYELKQKEFPITPEQQEELYQALGELAREAIDREDSRFRLRENFIKEFLGEQQQEGTLFWRACRLSLLNEIGNSAEKRHGKLYAFLHPSFQEYFAALQISEASFFLHTEDEDYLYSPKKLTGSYRILESKWREVFLFWLGRENIPLHEREKLIESLAYFEWHHEKHLSINLGRPALKSFYAYHAYFLAGIGLRELSNCKDTVADEITWQLCQWAFGYFHTAKKQWIFYQSPIREGALAALKESDSDRVLSDLDYMLRFLEHHESIQSSDEIIEKLSPLDPFCEDDISSHELYTFSCSQQPDEFHEFLDFVVDEIRNFVYILVGKRGDQSSIQKLSVSSQNATCDQDEGRIQENVNFLLMGSLIEELNESTETWDIYRICSQIYEIDIKVHQAKNKLSNLLNSLIRNDKATADALCLVSELLLKFDLGNPDAIIALAKLLQDDYVYFEYGAGQEPLKYLPKNSKSQNWKLLVPRLWKWILKPTSFLQYTFLFKSLWYSSQYLTYEEFHRCLYGEELCLGKNTEHLSSKSSIFSKFEMENMLKELVFNARDSVIPLSLHLDERQCEIEISKRILNRIFDYFMPEHKPPKISDVGDFEREVIGLKKSTNRQSLAILFYSTMPSQGLVDVCQQISDLLFVGWITDQPVPFRTFHPDSTDLVSAIQSWLDDIAQE